MSWDKVKLAPFGMFKFILKILHEVVRALSKPSKFFYSKRGKLFLYCIVLHQDVKTEKQECDIQLEVNVMLIPLLRDHEIYFIQMMNKTMFLPQTCNSEIN